MEKGKLLVKQYSTKKVAFDGFSLSRKEGAFCATSSFGCQTRRGSLTCGLGQRWLSIDGVDLVAPAGVTVYGFNFTPYGLSIGEVLMPLLSASNGISNYEESVKGFKMTLGVGDAARILSLVNEQGVGAAWIILANSIWSFGCDHWYTKRVDGEFTKVACGFASRLFIAKSDGKIVYSKPYVFDDFSETADESGYLHLPGNEAKIVQMVPLKEELYCFTEKSIYRITGVGAARDFQAERLNYSGGEVYEGSGAACGEKVFFFARDGIYAVRKGIVTKVQTDASIRCWLPLQGSEAAGTDGKYLMPCTYQGSKRTLSLDVETGEISAATFSSVLATYDGRVYGVNAANRLFELSSGYPLEENVVFERRGEPFGNARDKLLHSLRLYGKGEVSVKVTGRNGERQETVQLCEEGVDVRVLLKGKTFDVCLTLATATVLDKLEGLVQQRIR